MKMLQGAKWQTGIKMLTVFLSYLVWPTYAFSFTAENSRDGIGTFMKCTYMTLVCLNQPYSNVHSFKYDSKEVAVCLFTSCDIKTNNSGFEFELDTRNGIFKWKINPTKDEYKNKVFECSDGTITRTSNITAQFDETGWKSQNFAILIAMVIFVNILAVVLVAVYNRKIFCSDQQSKPIENLGQPNNTAYTSQKVRSNCHETFLVLCIPLAFFIVGIVLTLSLILATRFNNGAVLEEYVKICCWEILLILFGIYILIPGVPLLILAIVIKKKLDAKTAPASGDSPAIEMNGDGEDRRNKFVGKPRNRNDTGTDGRLVELKAQLSFATHAPASGDSPAIEMNGDGEDRGNKFVGKPRNGNDTGKDGRHVELKAQLSLATHDLPPVKIHTQTHGRNINILFRLENNIPNVLTTVCFRTNGTVTDLTEEKNTVNSDVFQGAQQKRIMPLPLHARTSSIVKQYDFPHWLKHGNTAFRVLKFPEIHHVSVVKNSNTETLVTVFVYWTTEDYKFLAKSEDIDYTDNINTKNKFETHIRPERRI